MDDRLENAIRRWGRQEEGPLSAAAGPTEFCLTFAEAERIARGGQPSRPAVAAHVPTCDYCKGLVADFREALAEGPSAAQEPARKTPRTIRLFRGAGLAVAASLLVGAGVGLFFALHRAPGAPILAGAEVGLQSYIESGLTPKGERVFATGDTIMFRVKVCGDGCLMVFNLEPRGRLVALPPKTTSTALVYAAREGVVTLGPYEVRDVAGRETCFVVATRQVVDDVRRRTADLQSVYDRAGNVEAVVEQITAWPAEVKVISFEHVPR